MQGAPKKRVQGKPAFVRRLGVAWKIKAAFPALPASAFVQTSDAEPELPVRETPPGQGPSGALRTGRR